MAKSSTDQMFDILNEPKTVVFKVPKTVADYIKEAAENEGITPEDWLISVITAYATRDSYYPGLSEFLYDNVSKKYLMRRCPSKTVEL